MFDFRLESKYVKFIVLFLLNDFYLLFNPIFDKLLFYIELDRDFLLGVPYI